jgi:hypothetical protein
MGGCGTLLKPSILVYRPPSALLSAHGRERGHSQPRPCAPLCRPIRLGPGRTGCRLHLERDGGAGVPQRNSTHCRGRSNRFCTWRLQRRRLDDGTVNLTTQDAKVIPGARNNSTALLFLNVAAIRSCSRRRSYSASSKSRTSLVSRKFRRTMPDCSTLTRTACFSNIAKASGSNPAQGR